MRSSLVLATRATAALTTAAVALGIGGLPSATAVDRDASFTTFSISSNVITARPTTQFFGNVETTATNPAIVSATTVVTVNGIVKGSVPLILGGNGGVDLPRGWGAGEVRLGPTTFTYGDGATSVNRREEIFNARRDIRVDRADNVALTVKRSGDTLRFRVQKLTMLTPSTGTYDSLRSVRLQALRGGAWRDVARVRLNRAGNGSVRLTSVRKYRYRLFSARSATRVRFSSARTGVL